MTLDDKYTEEESDRDGQRRRRTSFLEWLVVAHVGTFVVAATWCFGGQAEWVRPPLTAWGWLGALIALASLLRGPSTHRVPRAVWWWAAPIVAFNAIAIAAEFNPNLQPIRDGGEVLFAATGGNPHWPSAARPELARTALLQFDAIWIACFNIALLVTTRRAIRRLLTILGVNALILAVFGTVQKFAHAPGIFFGAIPTPQKYFFASFVYHNHWGAFIILMGSVCLALVVHYTRRHNSRGPWHSPAAWWATVLIIIVATVPFSASRSGTLLSAVLMAGAGLKWFIASVTKRREYNESLLPPILSAVVAAGFIVLASWYIAGDTIHARFQLTKEQLAEARSTHGTNQRYRLYRDTFNMGAAKPWFGWGMASYPQVFTIFNTQPPIPHFPVFYHDAHNDWLQSFAEHGLIGSAFLAAAAALPGWVTLRRRRASSVSYYLLAGCALILVYAMFEFPLGNYAVVLCWWALFYSALQYTRISRDSEMSPGIREELSR
jgi:O-antigen ligase